MSEFTNTPQEPAGAAYPGEAPVQADALFGAASAEATPQAQPGFAPYAPPAAEPAFAQPATAAFPTVYPEAAAAEAQPAKVSTAQQATAVEPAAEAAVQPSALESFSPVAQAPRAELEDDADEDYEAEYASEEAADKRAYMQNRELSWLTFNERVLDQGADESVPLLERLNFISIFWSNLQEFFMVRVGSLTDLSLIKPPVVDKKSGMNAEEQIQAIHERCRELYPIQESYYEHVRGSLAKQGVRHLRPDDLSDEQRNYLSGYVKYNIEPFLSPQIINPRHPFPHLENGKLYILLRLDDEASEAERKKKKKDKKEAKKKDKGGAEGVVLGLIPLPHQCDRVIKLPGRGFQFILLEHAIEMFAADIFSMYKIKHTNVICVTRNADIDANQAGDEQDEDYREHMKRLLKQRARLAPVRLECERPLSPVMEKHMLKKLGLKRFQVYDTIVPLDLSFTWGLGGRLTDAKREQLSNPPFSPAWPVAFDRKRRILDQVAEKEVLLSYPYESMDPFVQLLKEAAFDPDVVSIKITLYRLASQSQLAEALITAAENGKEVTALFELRARFDENNNIEWSQRFEQAGCNVIYGFRDYKVHSKICCITRRTPEGLQHITQLGTGNYNEKTAKLYTDLSFITTDQEFGRDAVEFFRNMQLENVSDNYRVLRVAPLQIKPMILENLDRQIALARAGRPCGAFLKANSITDEDVIHKIAEASQAGVGITLFVRGICCLVPEVKGATENVRVVSIVGRLLEHSRIYCFGTPDDCVMYLSSADLMTRNLNKRVEIAWPILNAEIRNRILDYVNICLHDTAKLRELRPNKTYTPLGAFCELDEDGNAQPSFDAQAALIEHAQKAAERVAELEESRRNQVAQLPTTLEGEEAEQIAIRGAHAAAPDRYANAEPPAEPEPQPAHAADLQAEYDPEPQPSTQAPEPATAYEPEPTPAYTYEPAPEPVPAFEPMPAFEPVPMPSFEQAPESAPDFYQAPSFEPSPEPETALEPAPEPAPAFEPAPEPALDYEQMSATIQQPSAYEAPAAPELAESLAELDSVGIPAPADQTVRISIADAPEGEPLRIALDASADAEQPLRFFLAEDSNPAEAPALAPEPPIEQAPAFGEPMPEGYAAAPAGYDALEPASAQPLAGYVPAPAPYAEVPAGYAQPPAGYAPAGYAEPPAGYVQPPAEYAAADITQALPADAIQAGASEQQPQPAGYAQTPADIARAQANESFIDEAHRDLEMPPKKGGFFSRLFRKRS